MRNKIILVLLLYGISQEISSDPLRERPIENRNLYLPFLLFLEPYSTTPVTLEKGKVSADSGLAISNMIDNNNAYADSVSGYSKYKPFFWTNYSEAFSDGRLTPNSYYLSEYLTYGRLEQQSNVKLDGEIERFHAKISYGLFKNFEIGIEITALSYNTGIFDKPITGYHRGVGIPYPLRDIYPNNQFNFELTDNSHYLIKGKVGTSSGDSVFDTKWGLRKQAGILPALAWINSVKIPTGNVNFFMGSGKLDVATGFSSKWNFYKFYKFLNVFGIIPSDPFHSRDVHIKPFATASSTIGYSFNENFSILTQVDVKGSPYRSGITMINQPAILWSFGFNWKFGTSCALRVNFTEDPVTRTVPDVSAQGSVLCISN